MTDEEEQRRMNDERVELSLAAQRGYERGIDDAKEAIAAAHEKVCSNAAEHEKGCSHYDELYGALRKLTD